MATLAMLASDMHDFVPFQARLLFRGEEVLEEFGFGFSLKI